MPQGAKVWLIPDGFLPAKGEGVLEGHEAFCILNTDDQDAHIEIDFFFEDRDPVLGVRIRVGAQRTLHVRTDRPDALGFELPRQVPYAARIRSDVPVAVQYSRMDVSQPNLTLMTSMAYPVGGGRPRTRSPQRGAPGPGA